MIIQSYEDSTSLGKDNHNQGIFKIDVSSIVNENNNNLLKPLSYLDLETFNFETTENYLALKICKDEMIDDLSQIDL
jgi:hypothetical protein